MKLMHRSIAPAAALVAALATPPARAALGEAGASIAADGRALSAVARGTTDRGAFSVHELVRGGTTIREFVSPQDVVFAVAWSGLADPDLGPLLGSYASDYQRAARSAPRVKGKRASRVAGDSVVVERWGHMRDRHGRAWVPDLVPQGVNFDEIR